MDCEILEDGGVVGSWEVDDDGSLIFSESGTND